MYNKIMIIQNGRNVDIFLKVQYYFRVRTKAFLQVFLYASVLFFYCKEKKICVES